MLLSLILASFLLLWSNSWDWVIYKENKLISYSSGGWEAQEGGTMICLAWTRASYHYNMVEESHGGAMQACQREFTLQQSHSVHIHLCINPSLQLPLTTYEFGEWVYTHEIWEPHSNHSIPLKLLLSYPKASLFDVIKANPHFSAVSHSIMFLWFHLSFLCISYKHP